MKRISVFGLGRLGLPLALHLADKGYNTIGVDVKEELVKSVNQRHMPFYEPGADDLIKKVGDMFGATTNANLAVSNSEASMIFVGTPNEDGVPFNPKYVRNVGREIAKAMTDYHLIVLRSTVFPGETSNLVRLIEKESGKKCGRDFGVCHNPEMLALGTVLHDLSNPQFVLIGESDKKAGDKLEELYSKITKSPVIRTTFENAELAKILINNYVTMKMNFANLMGELSETIPGTNPDILTAILGSDPRIRAPYLKAGTSYGGTCFPRDNYALIHLLKEKGMSTHFPETMIEMNKRAYVRIADQVQAKLWKNQGRRVSVMGMTFKPDTDVIEESASLKIADELVNRGFKVTLQGKKGSTYAIRKYGDKFKFEPDVYRASRGADALVFTLNSKEYRSVDLPRIKKGMRTPNIIDPWRMFK